jgi:hypothetical protein
MEEISVLDTRNHHFLVSRRSLNIFLVIKIFIILATNVGQLMKRADPLDGIKLFPILVKNIKSRVHGWRVTAFRRFQIIKKE